MNTLHLWYIHNTQQVLNTILLTFEFWCCISISVTNIYIFYSTTKKKKVFFQSQYWGIFILTKTNGIFFTVNTYIMYVCVCTVLHVPRLSEPISMMFVDILFHDFLLFEIFEMDSVKRQLHGFYNDVSTAQYKK